MTNLLSALTGGRLSPSQRRAKELAKADYRLLSSLVQVRKDLSLSQQDVADRLGVTQPTVAAFERSDADPKLSTIRRYAHAVGAIVTHSVEIDQGQYERVADWSASTYRVDRVPTYAASPSARPDFALVA
ncbi:helix-turn-helix domain-containing protein [Microbacterium sp. SS28]|uniref:helix-turn-helix domain-containing protein n=1 Tax=Microbacterium sp. SS28 TaxID=2919948 RepID=UPI001FAA9701|nr:helix-turn-helix domain-containing protein [Microbacterium sp. SS28]